VENRADVDDRLPVSEVGGTGAEPTTRARRQDRYTAL
jgi:hypothetical protein